MDRVSSKNYCGKKAQDNVFSSCSSRGKALVCSVAYPTAESRSEVACEKLCSISTDSFLRRPSLCDEAMSAIAGFINEGIYLYQEPEKAFLCSAAILYVFRGRARCIATGNSRVYHLRDDGPAEVARGEEDVLFGKRVRWEQKAVPEFELLHGSNLFLLCSGTEHTDLDKIVEALEWDGIAAAARGALGSSGHERQLETFLCGFRGTPCSATAVILPEAGRMPFPLWKRGLRERSGQKNE